MGDVARLALAVEAELSGRFAAMNKARRRGLAQVVGAMLTARTANMVELGNVLPRPIATWEKRYQFVERMVSHAGLDCDAIMASFAGDVARGLSARGETLVLMMDQSHINDLNEVLMVSLGFGSRALPVAWRVRATQGGIGFDIQEPLLNAVKAMLPEDASVLLCADRFYGTPALIDWCVAAGWDYRIRLKSNLTVNHGGGELTTGEVLSLAPQGIKDARLNGARSATNIFALHDPGHPEAWIIAMAAKPSRTSCLDYGLRWGIEAMFSDYKSRGFGLMQSQIERPERLEKLILIMAIAMYWAVSCGIAEAAQTHPGPRSKKQTAHSAPSSKKASASSEDASRWTSKFQDSAHSGFYEGW